MRYKRRTGGGQALHGVNVRGAHELERRSILDVGQGRDDVERGTGAAGVAGGGEPAAAAQGGGAGRLRHNWRQSERHQLTNTLRPPWEGAAGVGRVEWAGRSGPRAGSGGASLAKRYQASTYELHSMQARRGQRAAQGSCPKLGRETGSAHLRSAVLVGSPAPAGIAASACSGQRGWGAALGDLAACCLPFAGSPSLFLTSRTVRTVRRGGGRLIATGRDSSPAAGGCSYLLGAVERLRSRSRISDAE